MSVKKYSDYISVHEQKTRTIGLRSVNEAKKNGLGWTKSITGASSHNYARGSYLLDHEKSASEIAHSIEKAKQSGDIVSHEVETQDSGTSQHIISLNPKKFKNTKIQINTDKKKPGGMSWVNLD